MELTGQIIDLLPVEKGTAKSTGNEWQKRTFAIEVKDGDYTNKVAFELFGKDKINAFTNKVGDEVKVSFNIRSNEYNGKYFTSLTSWRIETIKSTPKDNVESDSSADTSDGLPF